MNDARCLFPNDLLISFLNALLHGEQVIEDITYMNSEQLGILGADRKAIFDVYCQNDKGEKFIVEMQKAEQQFFKDRSVFYSTFPIREQGQTGQWNYELETMFDKWMFVLQNLTSLMNRPSALQERIFERVFRVAEISQFTPVERSEYEESLKVLRDLTNVIDTAALRGYERGVEEGMQEGMRIVAQKMKSLSLPIATIIQATGLSAEEIESIE